ncbi:MAG: hypothetical protein ACOCQR_01070 [bacterium]
MKIEKIDLIEVEKEKFKFKCLSTNDSYINGTPKGKLMSLESIVEKIYGIIIANNDSVDVYVKALNREDPIDIPLGLHTVEPFVDILKDEFGFMFSDEFTSKLLQYKQKMLNFLEV